MEEFVPQSYDSPGEGPSFAQVNSTAEEKQCASVDAERKNMNFKENDSPAPFVSCQNRESSPDMVPENPEECLHNANAASMFDYADYGTEEDGEETDWESETELGSDDSSVEELLIDQLRGNEDCQSPQADTRDAGDVQRQRMGTIQQDGLPRGPVSVTLNKQRWRRRMCLRSSGID